MRERRDTGRYKTFTRRALMLGGAQVALLSALAGRMYYLQVVQSDQYRMLADENPADNTLKFSDTLKGATRTINLENHVAHAEVYMVNDNAGAGANEDTRVDQHLCPPKGV